MYLSTRTDLSLLNSNLNNKNKFHNIEGVWVADITLHYCETVKYFGLFIRLINKYIYCVIGYMAVVMGKRIFHMKNNLILFLLNINHRGLNLKIQASIRCIIYRLS